MNGADIETMRKVNFTLLYRTVSVYQEFAIRCISRTSCMKSTRTVPIIVTGQKINMIPRGNAGERSGPEEM